MGMLLNTSNNKYIVKSTARGVLSHNMNTWQCFGEFLEKGKQSKLSITIDNRIKSWFKNYNDKEIERMINAIFNILENNNIKEFKEIKNLKWSQIVKLISEVVQIHNLKKGEVVGYNGIFKAEEDTKIGVIPVGYADGIIRKNTGRYVYINNKKYKIVGNVCMDMLFVEIDEEVHLYDKVEVLKDNKHIKETANHLETIPYEILCQIGGRVPRIYKNN